MMMMPLSTRSTILVKNIISPSLFVRRFHICFPSHFTSKVNERPRRSYTFSRLAFSRSTKSSDEKILAAASNHPNATFSEIIYNAYAKRKRKAKRSVLRMAVQQELKLFQKYKSLHGDLDVKQNFEIPTSSDWPDWSHNYPLGLLVARMRHNHKNQRIRPSTYKLYSQLGFIWDFRTNKHNIYFQAFETYLKLFGNSHIPVKFVVPHDPQWPQNTWGLQIGSLAAEFRSKQGRHIELRKRLQEIGYEFGRRKGDFEIVYNALLAYKEKHGDVFVSKDYIIPKDDEAYPAAMRGVNLGEVVNNLRNHNSYPEYKSLLIDIGFIYEPMKSVEFHRIYSALERYKTVYGNVQVPNNYVIMEQNKLFDEELWGIKLGRIVKGIRLSGHYAEYRSYLAQLGLKIVSFLCVVIVN